MLLLVLLRLHRGYKPPGLKSPSDPTIISFELIISEGNTSASRGGEKNRQGNNKIIAKRFHDGICFGIQI